MQSPELDITPEVYQGQFGTFIITDLDRQGVVIYRSALMVAAICFGIATTIVLLPLDWREATSSNTLDLVTLLYGIFSIGLGVALATIHIYLVSLHRILQVFWAVGCISAMIFSLYYHQPIGSIVYQHPMTILGVGFTFAALTGIFFKEAFCFNRLETKVLVFLVPLLLLGHLTSLFSPVVESVLLAIWAGLFLVFAIRKAIQSIPPDLGDKSVFEYLKTQKHQAQN
jgi:uncharacterized integral membrane protein